MITKMDIDRDEIVGRLGNKLFQIAAGYSMAKKINDIFFIPPWKYSHVFPNVTMMGGASLQYTSIWSEPHFHYYEPPLEHFKGIVHINGYFQSDKYFSTREDIIKLFEFSDTCVKSSSELLSRNNINISEYTSIHVRRGDYTNLNHYYVDLCSTDYYINAMKNSNAKKFMVFSDDINFCKNYFSQFTEYEFVFVEGNPDYIDLYLMTLCKNNIIANSSFSWWGAYLNKNGGDVFVPSKWFVCSIESKDLYVNDWKVV